MGLLNTNNSYLYYYYQELPDCFIYSSINNDIDDIILYDDLVELTNPLTINDNINNKKTAKEEIEINHNIKKR